MRLWLLLTCAVIPFVLWAVLPLGSGAAPPSQKRLDRLEQRIDRTRARIGRKKGTERVLSQEIAGYTRRIGRLESRITTLAGRQAALQRDLDRRQAELGRIQARLRAERARLVRLRSRLKVVRRALGGRLVEMYKTQPPDLVTVVLDAEGFADLLERTEFLERVSDQDRRVVILVRDAKADAKATEARLDRLEGRQRRLTAAVLARREEVRQVKGELVGTRVGYSRTKGDKAAALVKVRGDRHELESHVDSLEREQGAVLAALQRAQNANRAAFSGSAPAAGPIRGSGRLIWPVNGPITGVFGESRPGHMHAGIDISAPTGTPIRAADSGKVVLMAFTGGYGNYTCIQHTATLSSCYAHQSSYATSAGANVRQGQVIGAVGSTGHSTGPHLHFEVRVNGSPVSPMGYL